MKISLRQILLAFLVLVIIAVIAGKLFTGRMVKRAIPDYNEMLETTLLNAAVTVYRDSIGVPHIEASNQHDLYFITGYLMAQDRLWQMDLLRRVTTGRLSEIFGADYVQTDQLLRALRFQKKSERILQHSTQEELTSLEAFAEGVNYYIANNAKKLPLEFTLLSYKPELWEPVHSLNLIGYMGWNLKSGWSELYLNELQEQLSENYIKELFPKNNHLKPAIFGKASSIGETLLQTHQLEKLGVEVLKGSNSWVVNGNKTTTGSPLLANDMHLGYGIPGIWYQVHQVIPDTLNVTGVALPGAPVIVVGHNDSIAWGMTNTYVKNIDFYEETTHPSDSLKYKYDGAWLSMDVDSLMINIKGGDSVAKVNLFTIHGPVVSKFKKVNDKVLTMKWVGDIEGNEFRSVFNVNRAHDWSSFINAFRTFRSISQNVNYADKKGNIGLIAAAGVPLRNEPSTIIFPGDTSLYEWKGVVPLAELPAIYNPEINYIVTANNLTTPTNFPYYIGSWHALPYRYNRITELIEQDSLLDAFDYMNIHTDDMNLHAQAIIGDLLMYCNNTDQIDSSYLPYVEIVNAWDFHMRKTSIAATIYNRFSYEFMYQIMADELGDKGFKNLVDAGGVYNHASYNLWHNKNAVWFDNVTTTEIKESYTDVLKIAFKNTIDTLQTQLGYDTNYWRWGDQHTLLLAHPLATVEALDKLFKLNRGPFPLAGHKYSVTNYAFEIQAKKPDVVHGASQRHIYDLANWDNSYTVIPTGNSGVPGSMYYCNQTELFVNGQYHRDHFSKAAYMKNAVWKAVYK